MSKSHGYGTSRQHAAGLFTPPPMARASAPPDRATRFRSFQQRLEASMRRADELLGVKRDRSRSVSRDAGAAGLDAAVRRVMSGGGSKALRRNTFAISTLPKMNTVSGGFIISHRECVGALSSDETKEDYKPVRLGTPLAAWPNGGLDIYPTNAAMFPWLSTIATRFEQYRWRKCNVQFITASGDGTTNSLAQGNVMAYIEYNPQTLIPPGSSQAFLNNYGATATKPSQSFQMGVQSRGNPFELKWTTRDGDARFDSDGSLYMATEGVPKNSVFGYLYIDYTIELHKPQVSVLCFLL